MENRAYGAIELRAVDDESRVITGIASSISTDRMGDIVDPKGAKFSLPVPLLWQHKHDQPVGWVEFAEQNSKNIKFRAKFAKIEEPGPLKTLVETAWQAVKAKLVRGVSIGFRAIDFAFMDEKEGDGIRFNTWEWLELSLVTIPANQDATIQTIRSLDQEQGGRLYEIPPVQRAALGNARTASSPGASGPTPIPKERRAMPTITENIAAYEAKRAAKAARMEELMTKAAEDGTTLDQAESEEYDTLKAEVEKCDEHLARFADLEKLNRAKASSIVVKDVASGSAARAPAERIKVKSPVPPGIPFARYVRAMALAGGNPFYAAELAKSVKPWADQTPEVEMALRTAVDAATTQDSTWAGPLVYAQNLASEFVEFLRPKTIIGRIPGLRRVPFNIRIPTQTGGSTVKWVGESKPKPVGELAFDAITLGITKIAGIVTYSDEVGRLSNPSIDTLIRDDLSNAIVQLSDFDFLDPDKSAVANVSPASVTAGVTPIQASGDTISDFLNDAGALFALFHAAGLGLGNTVWIMSDTIASYMGLMQNALGQPAFPSITGEGGTLLGRPVITSENMSTGMVVLLKADEVLLADDGGVNIDVSREASLQMNTAPDDPATASTVMRSLWQNNEIGVRAERFINWRKRRSTAVQFIANAGYGGAPGGSGT